MPRTISIPILMYHKVGFEGRNQDDSRLNVPSRRFKLHMQVLARLGRSGVTFRHALEGIGGHRSLPRRPVCVTFDDGFECVSEHAVPVLRALGWPATVFIPSAYIGRDAYWPGIEGWTPERIMGRDALIELGSLGWEVAGHGRSHADLSKLTDDEALEEITGGASELTEAIGAPVRSFAYPFGRFNERTPGLVRRAGFLGACTVSSGIARSGADPWRLPRVKPASRDGIALLLYRLWVRPHLP